MTDRDKSISPPGSSAAGPLRRRMTEDMTVRGFTANTRARIHPGGRGFQGLFSAARRTGLARMDRLLGPDKTALQAASVIGQPESIGYRNDRRLIPDTRSRPVAARR